MKLVAKFTHQDILDLVAAALKTRGIETIAISVDYDGDYDNRVFSGVSVEVEAPRNPTTPEGFMTKWMHENDPSRNQYIRAIQATRGQFHGLSLVEANEIRKKVYNVG